jgi:hypothetical protein
MQRALKEIGWELKDDRLIPASLDVRELFFPDQTQHDAYVEIRTILQQARKSVLLVDPYIDESILTLLGTCASAGMEFQILSAKLPSDFELEAKKWISQHKVKLQVRKTRDFHDRFLLLDGSRCWHIGCSIKDAGNRAFMLSQVEDEANRTPLVAKIVDAWESGTPVL